MTIIPGVEYNGPSKVRQSPEAIEFLYGKTNTRKQAEMREAFAEKHGLCTDFNVHSAKLGIARLKARALRFGGWPLPKGEIVGFTKCKAGCEICKGAP